MIGSMLVIVVSLLPLLPSAHDKHGWGLRVHSLSTRGPLLAGEHIEYYELGINLINFSDRTQSHDPLIVAMESSALEVIVLGPNAKPIGTFGEVMPRRCPFAVPVKLPPGKVSSAEFRFGAFGYWLLAGPGRYRVEAKMNIDGKVVSSPHVQLEVLDPKSETLLLSQAVPLEGDELKRPTAKQTRPFVQQVKVGARTLLIYRQYDYDGPDDTGGNGRTYLNTFRLAELPGKVDMKVTGGYGDWGPLTINYADKQAPNGSTKLVINSVNGLPWTDEDQESYNLKHNIAPAPRPKP